MNYKIVTDSSANLLSMEGIDISIVPLHILVGAKEYTDDSAIDLEDFQKNLSSYNGKTSTACPSPIEWETAFGNADVIFCVTITSGLSGCCSSAYIAKVKYESEHPGRKVYIIDSLSTGPEMVLILEKLKELSQSELSAEEVYERIRSYQKNTHLCFSLASVDNFAKNGRINPIIAKGVGLLGIKILGQASEEGTLQILSKCHGDKRAYRYIIEHLKKLGYSGGKIIIAHNHNELGARELQHLLRQEFGSFESFIHKTRGLCSYYAEPESILVGFEA